jgi:chloramphenicol O-acetyltransferase type B
LDRLIYELSRQPGWPERVHQWTQDVADRPVSDPRVRVGRHTYGVHAQTVFMARDEDRLSVGNFCSVAEGVRFIYGNHPVNTVTTFPLRTILVENWQRNVDAISRGPIIVGNDVWIASESLILSGVTIGDGAVIGAGSVVTRDVAPYSLTAGAPARHLRFRHTEAQVARLLRIRWWDWPDEKVLAHLDELYGDVEAFIARFASPSPV